MSVDEPRWWWETKQRGEIVPLAFVKIDRVGSTGEWESLPEDAVTRRRARYAGSIEDLARYTGAAQPLRFQGDGVMLFYTDGDDGRIAPIRAFEAARALWERMAVDLSLPTRIAVHAAWVAWHPDLARISGGPKASPSRRRSAVQPLRPSLWRYRSRMYVPAENRWPPVDAYLDPPEITRYERVDERGRQIAFPATPGRTGRFPPAVRRIDGP